MDDSCDLLVIGGGVGGLVTSSGAAKMGLRVILVEKRHMGGDCLNFGCVPTKTLIRSARIAHWMGRAREFGLDPGETRVDFPRVMGRVRQVIASIGEHESAEAMGRQGVEVVMGQGRFLDPHTFEVNGRRIRARKVILATGSRPILLPIPGLAEAKPLTNESALQLDHLPASLIILGAGPIGIEFGQAFARLGSRVTFLEKESRILPREDPEVADVLKGVLTQEGLEIHTGTEVKEIRREGDRKVVVTAQDAGARPRRFEAEELLVAIGRTPNVDGLNLEAAGVQYTKRGVQVDATHRTTARHIWAVGDVTGKVPFTHAAEYEAVAVLRNILLPVFPQRVDESRIPWVTFSDPELGRIGLTEAEARKQMGDGIKVFRYPFPKLDRAIIEGEPQGLIKVITDRSGRILGAHLLGPGAGELLHEFVLARTHGLKLPQISDTVHVYPTLSQAVKRSADEWFLEQLSRPWLRKLARWTFSAFP